MVNWLFHFLFILCGIIVGFVIVEKKHPHWGKWNWTDEENWNHIRDYHPNLFEKYCKFVANENPEEEGSQSWENHDKEVER